MALVHQPSKVVAGSGDGDVLLALYERMVLIRRVEEAIQSLFQRGEVHGTTHLYLGQEAVATGVASALTAADRVAGTYRGHGHALAQGVEPRALIAELLGRESGVCGGRAGSMNVIDLQHGLIGCFGIIGGSIAAATGAAIALRRSEGVAVAFFGDGTVNHGYFHECLNFAKVQCLPLVLVCENNLYGEFTPWEDVTAGQITARPNALEIPAEIVDGMDVWAIRRAALDAAELARGGAGPHFIEARTYRFAGHSRSDPGAYRKPGELERWKARDPLSEAARTLTECCGVSAGTVSEVDDRVTAQVADAVNDALDGAWPDPEAPAREFQD